jgi:alpha-amylase
MSFVTICFSVHQPYCLNDYSPVDVGNSHSYFNEDACGKRIDILANKCLLPANKLLLHLIKKHGHRFNVSFSISGITLELLQRCRPDIIGQFKELADTGCVEFLGETYNNSLSWIYSKKEFERQVLKHKAFIRELFGLEAQIFRNTELIHNNELTKFIHSLGFKGMICEASDEVLNNRSRNRVFASPGNAEFASLLRNFRMSDDIAFRFGEESWSEHPLTAQKFASWIHGHNNETECINLLPDYETFGIYKTKETGIFNFLNELPQHILANEKWSFALPSEVIDNFYPTDVYDVKQPISWQGKVQASCAWSENAMQNNMLRKIYGMEQMVKRSGDEKLLDTWERLQSSDYFSYMSLNQQKSDDANQCLNPYGSAEEAYRNYLNIITDFELRLIKKSLAEYKKPNYHHDYSTLY